MVYEDSQRPFMLPKDDQKWDAHAVETTAFALLVYVARDGIGIIQENIVRFLAVMRELDGGLISTLVSNRRGRICFQQQCVCYQGRVDCGHVG